ncbi:VacJ family lipoprotein [Novosphingobium sp. JCM 18896]|uniref:MlaA family lipoprotein n=1 Tax=Novosphingobium sp. JCM 18896 TaxID=2989731 RepID=UPI002222A004|nr:VacJ family lipoprotein [Novosphingobium sp. JCM 18896]MCW1430063.1 VacJ family lipoprotein [Novosphingobium sp. JCM 18896]
MSISLLALALATVAPGDTPAEAPASPAPPVEIAAPAAEPAPAAPAEAPTITASAPADGPGDIVVTAREKSPADPLAALNAKSYETIQAVDEAVVGPVSLGYKKGMPKPLRLGLRNFLRNLEEPVIAFNYLLQLKPGRAVKSVGRFAINSTAGVGGLIDVAKRKPFNLPYTPNGFANTFACYGIGPGPYFFLPLVGPTTLRDLIGVGMDRAALPAVVGKPLDQPYYAIPANVIDALNDRIDIDEQLKQVRAESADPYTETRELYLRQRRAEIAAICPKKGQAIEQGLPPRPGKGRD